MEAILKSLRDHQQRVIERPQYQCASCGEFFPSDKIKLLCRLERGEWVDVLVCPEHEKEWLDQGGWRG